MAEFGGALDKWLEAPYTDAARWEADFEAWCQANGVDPEDDNAQDRFEAHMGAIDAAAEAEIDAAEAADEKAAYAEMGELEIDPNDRFGPGDTRRLLR